MLCGSHGALARYSLPGNLGCCGGHLSRRWLLPKGGSSQVQPFLVGLIGENPSGLGGWGNRHSLTGSCAGGPVVFQRCEHRVSPGAPLSIPHLCPWVKARSSFPAGSDFMWGSLGPLDVAGGDCEAPGGGGEGHQWHLLFNSRKWQLAIRRHKKDMSSWHGHSAAEILLTGLHARKEQKKYSCFLLLM